jgi:hypothetical protein
MQSRIALHEAGGALRSRGMRRLYIDNRVREHAPTMPQGGGEDTEGQGSGPLTPGLTCGFSWWARQGLNL